MIDLLNIACALLTIAFGLFGLVAPRYTAEVLDLAPKTTTMGLSEMRASAGGLFVALGIAAIVIATPMAFAMMGVAYAGAAIGRLTSIALDKPPFQKAFFYFGIEALFAAWLIIANV